MPYKNPEDKCQWESQHREQRNEQRRMRRLLSKKNPIPRNPEPDQVSMEQRTSGWKGIIAFGVAVGLVAIAFSGMNIPSPQAPPPDIRS